MMLTHRVAKLVFLMTLTALWVTIYFPEDCPWWVWWTFGFLLGFWLTDFGMWCLFHKNPETHRRVMLMLGFKPVHVKLLGVCKIKEGDSDWEEGDGDHTVRLDWKCEASYWANEEDVAVANCEAINRFRKMMDQFGYDVRLASPINTNPPEKE